MTEMNIEFKEELVGFLDSECDDYDMDYEILTDTYDDSGYPKVDVKIYIKNSERSTVQQFGWKYLSHNTMQVLCIDMHEDNWESICWYDSNVKYFWMAVAPEIWGKQ